MLRRPRPHDALEPRAPERVLVVRLSHLGDVVHALCVYHAVRARYPAAHIGWAVQPEFAELVRGLPGVTATPEFRRRDGARAWFALRRALEQFAADVAIDCQGNTKSAAATWLSRAARRIALDPGDWREPFAARVATETAPPARGRSGAAHAHAMDRMLALARHVAGDPDFEPRRDPALGADELARGRALAAERLPRGQAPVLLQLGDPSDVRSWPLEHHVRLARALEAARVPHLVLSGPGEAQQGALLQRELGASPLRAHWVGQRGLRELAAFFAASAERGGRFVGADSGPLHLAAAVGLSVVALEGPQSHRRTGPWPLPGTADSPHAVVGAASPPACAPCLARRCTHSSGPVCMRDLEPELVLAQVLASPATPV